MWQKGVTTHLQPEQQPNPNLLIILYNDSYNGNDDGIYDIDDDNNDNNDNNNNNVTIMMNSIIFITWTMS